MSQKLWGGRFSKTTDPLLYQLNASIDLDKRLYSEDIRGSQAYATALCKVNLLTPDEKNDIINGLERIKGEWDSGEFEIKEDEDIHTANERRLKELIGEAASKLHVGRSRNDQVITDMKLWMKKAIEELKETLRSLISVMVAKAEKEIDILMPGYTHMQRAQVVRWSHWLLSHAWSFKNDSERLHQLLTKVNISPLGSGALAGNPFGIDRKTLAEDMGFDDITQNSMQAVGDRDFVAEFLFWASLTGVHLSRLAEDLIIFSSAEFGFVTMDDSFSTGSSLMPQKKNADSLELIRGVGGSIFGQCSGFMMTLKGLPSTYNKDLQYDKEAMFGTFDKTSSMLRLAAGAIETLQVNKDKCQAALSPDLLATDLAYYLVRKGVAFRVAHHLTGKVVTKANDRQVPLSHLETAELQKISSHFGEDVKHVWNYENSANQYEAIGGTAKTAVLEQIKELKKWNGQFFVKIQ